MKSLLFVINTMGMGGAEHALLELLGRIDPGQYEVSLFVLTGQGELLLKLPPNVKLLNHGCVPVSVLDPAGQMVLFRTAAKALVLRGMMLRRAKYMIRNLYRMIRKGKVQKDKLLWKILADSVQRPGREYDLAVAYLEGGAAYYVASHVKARKKAVFLHIDYRAAGYTRELDEDCYLAFDRVFAVSENVRDVFLSVYPECRDRTEVFRNLIDREAVVRRAGEPGGFSDDYDGFRILTVSRLVPQKALHTAIHAMKILKDSGKPFRWYVLGEGELRGDLEEQIRILGLKEDFLLPGTVENPYPYYVQCDLYVHTSAFEGRSIAVEEAQILGCAILASEHDGIQEQIADGVDGRLCGPEAEVLAAHILYLQEHPDVCRAFRQAASEREQTDGEKEMEKLMGLLEDDPDGWCGEQNETIQKEDHRGCISEESIYRKVCAETDRAGDDL